MPNVQDPPDSRNIREVLGLSPVPLASIRLQVSKYAVGTRLEARVRMIRALGVLVVTPDEHAAIRAQCPEIPT